MLFVNSTELIILLVVCAVAAACFVAAVVLLVWTVRNQRRKQRGNRELVEIVADCKDVKSEFSFGEEFSCEGLLVNAVYNRNPKSEALSLFDVLTEEELVRLTEAGAASGLYVIKPNMEETGRTNVIVRYKDKATYYAITIAEPAQESTQEPVQEPHEEPAQEVIVQRREPIAPEEESYEGVLRYNKSFMAKYIKRRRKKQIYGAKKRDALLQKGKGPHKLEARNFPFGQRSSCTPRLSGQHSLHLSPPQRRRLHRQQVQGRGRFGDNCVCGYSLHVSVKKRQAHPLCL